MISPLEGEFFGITPPEDGDWLISPLREELPAGCGPKAGPELVFVVMWYQPGYGPKADPELIFVG